MTRLRPFEIFLIELILFFLLWWADDYIATLVSLIFGSICLFILVIALIAEMIERSRVPRWYFYVMALSVVAPLLVAVIYIVVIGAELEWLS